MTKSLRILLIIAIALSLTSYTAAEETAKSKHTGITIHRVMMLGDPAPGTAQGVTFNSPGGSVGYTDRFGSRGVSAGGATLNSAGQCAFMASLWGPGIQWNNYAGIWLWDPQKGIQLIARYGDPPAGNNGDAVFSGYCVDFASLHLADDGQVAFLGGIAKPSANTEPVPVYFGSPDPDVDYIGYAIWKGDANRLNMIAMAGEPAPYTDHLFFWACYSRRGSQRPPEVAFDSFSMNPAGHIAFSAELTTEQWDRNGLFGIWIHKNNRLKLIAQSGDPAPGNDEDINFKGMWIDPLLTRSGHLVFRATVSGPKVEKHKDWGIWQWDGNEITLVTRMAIEPSRYGRDLLTINDEDQIVFATNDVPLLDVPGGLWVWNDEKLTHRLTLERGDFKTNHGLEFVDCYNPLLSGHNKFVFMAEMFNPDLNRPRGPYGGYERESCLWAIEGDALTPVLKTGDNPPGVGEAIISDIYMVQINKAGQMVICGDLTGPDVNQSNSRAIWLADPQNKLTCILRQGDPFDVDDDPNVEDIRTIAHIFMYEGGSGEDGRPVVFNDRGDLLLQLSFTDGTAGIFIASPDDSNAIPSVP